MSRQGKLRHLTPRQKTLAKLFDEACYRTSRGTAWSDFVTMAPVLAEAPETPPAKPGPVVNETKTGQLTLF